MTTTHEAAPDIRTPTSFDRDYWLRHSEGFRVDTTDGRLGFVEEVRVGDDRHGDVLAIRAGMLGRRIVLVPASEVDFIVPRIERIWLHSPARIIGTEPPLTQR